MDDVRLRRLISRWLDGNLESHEFDAMTEHLRTSEEARRTYLFVMGINAELHNSAAAQQYLGEILDCKNGSSSGLYQVEDRNKLSQSPILKTNWPIWGLAATILIALGAMTQWDRYITVKPEISDLADSVTPFISEIQFPSGECHWYVEHADRLEASSLRDGDIIRVTEGSLTLRYEHGTEVELSAPAAFQLISAMEARLLVGKLSAEVSEAGKGFSVITPRATIIDLGTCFSVDVKNDGATDVVVAKGEVVVDYSLQGETTRRVQHLLMGEAVRLDAAGTASRIVSITSRSSDAEQAGRPLIITEIRDNIERMSSLNYYEIVHAGMCEDALAFVDREAHQWNGIDASGMPPYLIGGDYVKMFNNDKFKREIRIRMTLASPAKVYVLVDNRLPVPDWLKQTFQDTGDDIGLDTGPFFSKGNWHNQEAPGVGPGESVEDTFSVWEKEVNEPGDIYLGSTEAPFLDPEKYGINMYAIVVMPLDEEPGN